MWASAQRRSESIPLHCVYKNGIRILIYPGIKSILPYDIYSDH